MAHLTLFPGNHEIVEVEEELNPDEHHRNNNYMKKEEKDRMSLASNLEEDLNQLFEMFNRRASSQSCSNQGGSSRKNASKKPVKYGGSHSPGNGISDRVNLKQALRGLCLSQASEMAAMKRSPKSGRSSEAGRIMTLYRNVVVEDGTSEISRDDDRGGMLEISLVPEDPTFQSFQNSPESLLASDMWPSNRSSLAEKGGLRVLESMKNEDQLLSPPKTLPPSSSPPSARHSLREVNKSVMTDNGKYSPLNEFASQNFVTEVSHKEKRVSSNLSHPSYGKTSLELARKMPTQKEIIPASLGSKNQMSKEESTHTPRYSDPANRDLEHSIEKMAEEKEETKLDGQVKEDLNKNSSPTSQLKSTIGEPNVQNDSLNIISPSGSIKKANRPIRSTHHFVKPLIKTRNFVKRKSKKKKKMVSDNSPINIHSEFHNDLYAIPHPIVCPSCQCVVTDAWKETHQESSASHQESPESYQDSPISPFVSLSADVSSGNVISDVSTTGPSSVSLNKFKAVISEGIEKDSKLTEKGECSSSTSYSEESNLSRPSFCDRPHMSRDIRWEAIRRVRSQNETIGLRHFNLLKKLGCGDIGTVYLAELISTNCLFAIKVMDNEFLARRKKIARAQTEREILRILDHPFLPTLYSQFTSDNLSCLVMEYCPGGDLHVLRQRQPGRCFTEQAARFYVAEVLLALEYLHMLGVIYRDLKPENILVREDGHIMLSDFDLSLRCAVSPTLLISSSMSETSKKTKASTGPCSDSRCVEPLCIEPSCQVSCFTRRLPSKSKTKLKKLKSDLAAELRPLLQLVAEPTAARSNSFVGTHEYLAPEIIKGEGHGSAVDWWTFGIFLYELLYGRTPFKGAGNEDTLANVVLQNLKFPDSPLVSLQARDLINTLLVKEPENRLGTERGAAEIKQHPFFNGLNWALIRCAVPPELPECHSQGIPNGPTHEKNNKYEDFSPESGSGSGSRENVEFEVF